MNQYCVAQGDNFVSQRHFSKAMYTLHFPFSDAEIAAMCLRWRKPGSDETYHHEHSADVDINDDHHGRHTPRSTRHGRRTARGSKGVNVLYIPLLRAICGADNAGWDAGQIAAPRGARASGLAGRSRVPAVQSNSDDDDDEDELGENGAFELTRKLAAHDFYEQMYHTSGGHRHREDRAHTSRHSSRKSRTHGGHSALVSGTPRRGGHTTSRHRVDGHVSHTSRASRTFGGGGGGGRTRSSPTASLRQSTRFGRSPGRASSRPNSSTRASSRNFGDTRSRR